MIPQKQKWMEEGAIVIVLGKTGKITKLHAHNFGGMECVSLIEILIDGTDEVQSYYPNDVSEYAAGTQIKIENQ